MTGQRAELDHRADSRADDALRHRSGIRRTALALTLVALAFYVGFILIGVVNAQG